MTKTFSSDEQWTRVFHIAIAVSSVEAYEEDLHALMDSLTKNKKCPILDWMVLPCHNPEPGLTGYLSKIDEAKPSPFDERSTVDGVWPFIQPKQKWSVVRVRNSIYNNVEILDVVGDYVRFQGNLAMFEDVIESRKRLVVCPIKEITLMEERTT